MGTLMSPTPEVQPIVQNGASHVMAQPAAVIAEPAIMVQAAPARAPQPAVIAQPAPAVIAQPAPAVVPTVQPVAAVTPPPQPAAAVTPPPPAVITPAPQLAELNVNLQAILNHLNELPLEDLVYFLALVFGMAFVAMSMGMSPTWMSVLISLASFVLFHKLKM